MKRDVSSRSGPTEKQRNIHFNDETHAAAGSLKEQTVECLTSGKQQSSIEASNLHSDFCVFCYNLYVSKLARSKLLLS